jgi:hypothetical protein
VRVNRQLRRLALAIMLPLSLGLSPIESLQAVWS